jgi:ABC-type phosphate transport system substrate-binding protein
MKKIAIALAITIAAVGWHGTSVAGPDAKDDIVVVANKGFSAKSLSREDLRPVFQTTKAQWPDGSSAVPLNLADDSLVRHGFDAAVLGLDPDRVARFWVDRKIRGGERPPRKVSNASAVLRAVAGDKGAVGYVSASEVNDTVKVVAKIHNGQVMAP